MSDDSVGQFPNETPAFLRDNKHECDCEYCGHNAIKSSAIKVEAVWDADGYSWVYRTATPHSTFVFMEDGVAFCRGIIIHKSDLDLAHQVVVQS